MYISRGLSGENRFMNSHSLECDWDSVWKPNVGKLKSFCDRGLEHSLAAIDRDKQWRFYWHFD